MATSSNTSNPKHLICRNRIHCQPVLLRNMLSFHIPGLSTVRRPVMFVDMNYSIVIFVQPVPSIITPIQLARENLTNGIISHEA
jgi:hypothetical protein